MALQMGNSSGWVPMTSDHIGNQRLDTLSVSLADLLQAPGRIHPFPNMLNWTLIFLLLALISGVLGFTSIAGGAASIGRILFFAFLVLLVVSAAGNALRDRTP